MTELDLAVLARAGVFNGKGNLTTPLMIAHTHTPQSILATTLDPRLLKSQNCSHIFKNEFIALGVIMKQKNQLEYSAFEAEKPAGVFSFFSQKIYLFATRLQF